MKKDIHPTYNNKVKATCSCGATFVVDSTSSEIKTEICSNCHPFYTGKQKLIDSSGNVERFKKKMRAKDGVSEERKGKKVKRAIRAKVKAGEKKSTKTASAKTKVEKKEK